MAKIISLLAHAALPPRPRAAPLEGRAQILFFTGVRYERPAALNRRIPRKAKHVASAAATAEIIG